MPKTSGTSADESGILTVWVPYDAKVSINGLATKSTGSRRQFVSFGLKSGLTYKYVVKAQVVRNGQTQEDTRTVTLTAGQVTAVAFGFNVTGPTASGVSSVGQRWWGRHFACPGQTGMFAPPVCRGLIICDTQEMGPRGRIWPVRGLFLSCRHVPICG